MKNFCKAFFLSLCLLSNAWVYAQAKPPATVEIIFWHSFAGSLGDKFADLMNDFNQHQQRYVVHAIYKGDYISALTSFAAAFQAKQAPALMQVFEVGTTSMLIPEGVIEPIEAVLKKHHKLLPKTDFFPAVREFYSQAQQLQALPLNTSVPVLFYNADLLQKYGYNQTNFPKTWDQFEVLAQKLHAAGQVCVYTTAFPAWIHIEAFTALHGLNFIEPHTKQSQVKMAAIGKHLTRLKRWQIEHYFEYGGRASDATVLFTSGRCALFSQSSGAYNSLSEMVNFHVGVAPLPFDTDISKHRYSNVAGGAALWAIRGQSDEVYAGIAELLEYLMRPEVQQKWYEQTGYIPLGVSGRYQSILAKDKQHSTLLIAKQDLTDNPNYSTVPAARGPLNLVRMINDEAMEAIFAGIKTPQQAMDDAIRRTQYAIMRFKNNTQWV